VLTFVQRRHDSDDSNSSAATTRYNLLEATTETESDGDLHETLAARTKFSASRVSGTAKPSADASESDAVDSNSLSNFKVPLHIGHHGLKAKPLCSAFTGTDTDVGSDDFEHESLPDSEPDNDSDEPLAEVEAPVKQWCSLIHKFTTNPKDSPAEPDSESESAPSEDLGNLAPPNDVSDGRSSCADEQRPPSRTDSVKTLCYDAEDYESINSFSLPEVQAESRSRGNAGDPFDANDQFDFNPAMISACLFRFIRQHNLFDSLSGGQAIPEGYEPLKPAASIWPSNEPAPGCQHFV